jgi:hypothetical protein
MPVSLPEPVQPTVLVVYASAAVGGAIAQRLMDTAVVALASVSSALTALAGADGYDVVVLCPYLDADERARVLARVSDRAHPAPVVEVSHVPGGAEPGADVVAHARNERAAARAVVAALTRPVAA